MATDMPQKIDVHVHFLPPAYRQACLDHGHANPDGMPYLPEWSEEAHLQLMDKTGIAKSILSISTPGTHLVYNDKALAAKVTRDCNSYAADLKKRGVRIAIFSTTPQVNTSANTTNALLRFSHCLGTNIRW